MPPPESRDERLKTYFGGHGEKVMRSFKKTYGEQEGERAFYATVNQQRERGTTAEKKQQPRHVPGSK